MRPGLYNIAHSSRFSQMGHRGEFGRPPIEAALIIPDALATPTFKQSHGRFGNRVGHDLADVHHERARLSRSWILTACGEFHGLRFVRLARTSLLEGQREVFVHAIPEFRPYRMHLAANLRSAPIDETAGQPGKRLMLGARLASAEKVLFLARSLPSGLPACSHSSYARRTISIPGGLPILVPFELEHPAMSY
jgi:hypothetical protein